MKNTNLKKNRRNISGVFFLDKPGGFTSQQALYRVKRAFRALKAGHTGSLDPLATGMLPVCFGEATKYADYLLSATKVYEVTAQLGTRTTTGDIDGKVLEQLPVTESQLEAVDDTIKSFLGSIIQIPPMYSAVKFQGTPLYVFARHGEEVERIPRETTIFSIERLESDQQDHIALRVSCSKGTYIRTLVEDMGNALGCGACVLRLRRTQVGDYTPEYMIPLDEVEKMAEQGDLSTLDSFLKPMTLLVDYLPIATVDKEGEQRIKYGMVSPAVFSSIDSDHDNKFQIVTEAGEFLGIGQRNERGYLAPKRLLVTE